MFVPRSAPRSTAPLEPGPPSPPGPDLGGLFEGAGRRVLSQLGLPAAGPSGTEPLSAGARGRGFEHGASEAERGPDRVGDMPGGAEALVRLRKARRRELLKEATNVVAGCLVGGLVTGVVLLESGVGPAGALVAAVSVAGGWGWILGREVVADLARNTEFLQRDRDVW